MFGRVVERARAGMAKRGSVVLVGIIWIRVLMLMLVLVLVLTLLARMRVL
jgi:hypothetical protein